MQLLAREYVLVCWIGLRSCLLEKLLAAARVRVPLARSLKLNRVQKTAQEAAVMQAEVEGKAEPIEVEAARWMGVVVVDMAEVAAAKLATLLLPRQLPRHWHAAETWTRLCRSAH